MGAGARPRKTDHNPASPAESLWYAGVNGKAFLVTALSPREFVFIPDDLVPFFHRQK